MRLESSLGDIKESDWLFRSLESSLGDIKESDWLFRRLESSLEDIVSNWCMIGVEVLNTKHFV